MADPNKLDQREIGEVFHARLAHVLLHAVQEYELFSMLPRGLSDHTQEVKSDEIYCMIVMCRRLKILTPVMNLLLASSRPTYDWINEHLDKIYEFEEMDLNRSPDDTVTDLGAAMHELSKILGKD